MEKQRETAKYFFKKKMLAANYCSNLLVDICLFLSSLVSSIWAGYNIFARGGLSLIRVGYVELFMKLDGVGFFFFEM